VLFDQAAPVGVKKLSYVFDLGGKVGPFVDIGDIRPPVQLFDDLDARGELALTRDERLVLRDIETVRTVDKRITGDPGRLLVSF